MEGEKSQIQDNQNWPFGACTAVFFNIKPKKKHTEQNIKAIFFLETIFFFHSMRSISDNNKNIDLHFHVENCLTRKWIKWKSQFLLRSHDSSSVEKKRKKTHKIRKRKEQRQQEIEIDNTNKIDLLGWSVGDGQELLPMKF